MSDKIVNPFFQLPNENPLTCHVFCFPGSPANQYYSVSHFAQLAKDVCWMLKATGNKVHYYGYPSCDVECDEKIVVGDEDILKVAHPELFRAFGHMDPSTDDGEAVDYLYERWAIDTAYQVQKRYSPGDFFLWILPAGHQRFLYQKLESLPVRHVEPSVGYIGGFLPYKVFQSDYIRSFHYGMYHTNNWWYNTLDEHSKSLRPHGSHAMHTYTPWETPPQHDDVIAIPFDISQFDFRLKKKDYLLCLARVVQGKGIKEAVELSERLGMKLIIAGPGDVEATIGKKVPKNVEVRGAVGVEERTDLLSYAYALLCLSELYETFGMAAKEAQLSGTVPIVSDRGAFLETVEHGYNGFHVDYRSPEQAMRAVENVGKIDPYNLRDSGLRCSREYLSPRYNAFLQNIDDSIKGMEPTYPQWADRKEKINWPAGWMVPVDTKEKKDA